MSTRQKQKCLPAKYGLSSEVKFCKRCVYSNQRPCSSPEFKYGKGTPRVTLTLDKKEVCVPCRYHEYEETEVDWKQREKELLKLLDRHRSKDGSYDVIIPGSGGKDSHYQAYVLKYKYGMNPLTVTWASHLYTQVGWENFQKWVHMGGYDNILVTPNGQVHRLLTKLAFENLLHPFQPFIVGQKQIGPHMAIKYNTPLVMYGESAAETGLQVKGKGNTMETHLFTTKDISSIKLGGVSLSELEKKYGVSKKDLQPYLPPTPEMLKKHQVEVHYLGYYVPWRPLEHAYLAERQTGWQPNTERTEGTFTRYASLDDKTDGFHYYTTFIKFGFGRATHDAAQMIRNGYITREEGIALVHKYDGEFPQKYFGEFLDYIGISEKRFWELIEKGRSPHLWKKEKGEWKLRHQVR